ncbi:hypothetical protein LXA43DRAFT_214596 [Ganoderma leucocontextum]|nr:hypothetical protein LXA43DRAFT_214596 [Ganoderma leucocontextum]
MNYSSSSSPPRSPPQICHQQPTHRCRSPAMAVTALFRLRHPSQLNVDMASPSGSPSTPLSLIKIAPSPHFNLHARPSASVLPRCPRCDREPEPTLNCRLPCPAVCSSPPRTRHDAPLNASSAAHDQTPCDPLLSLDGHAHRPVPVSKRVSCGLLRFAHMLHRPRALVQVLTVFVRAPAVGPGLAEMPGAVSTATVSTGRPAGSHPE